MTRNITVLYPDEKIIQFTVETDKDNNVLLQWVFDWFNFGSGCECSLFINSQVRSFSVNDFICIDGFWYQCESVGWKPCCEAYVQEIVRKVSESVNRKFSAFFALSEIMYDIRKADREQAEFNKQFTEYRGDSDGSVGCD